MGYYIDLASISIDQFKGILKSTELIPSWKVLKDNIDENLNTVKANNIQNVDELKKILKTTNDVKKFSEQSGLPEDYLVVLRRVINGYHPKPNKIKNFPGISEDISAKLEQLGPKDTLHLYEEIQTTEKRRELSIKTGVSEAEIMKLAKLTDLSRVRWVNHTFAHVLLEAGYDTAEKVANADSNEMYDTIRQLNEERDIYKGNIGAHDMKMCIEAAQGLDFDIEYQ